MSVLVLVMSFYPYLRSAMVGFPLHHCRITGLTVHQTQAVFLLFMIAMCTQVILTPPFLNVKVVSCKQKKIRPGDLVMPDPFG